MLDKVLLQIPFSSAWVDCALSVPDFEKNASDPFTRDFVCSVSERFLPVSKGAKSIFWNNVTKVWDQEEIYCPWESISSGHSGLALKVYHQGNAYCKWPYIELKCSPAKLIQGHNVFGYDDLRKAIDNMLFVLKIKYPSFFDGYDVEENRGALLDFKHSRVSQLDITYSISIKKKNIRLAVIDFVRSISKGHTKPSGDSYETTAYFGKKNSRVKNVKIYDKLSEVENDNKDRAKKRKELISNEIITISDGLLRFEATAKKQYFESRMIPTNAFKMIQFFEADKTNYRKIFDDILKDLFDSLENQKVNIMNDNEIFEQINLYAGETRGKAARIYGTYQSIKAVGLERFKKQHTKTTYHRLIAQLLECGFSKGVICNLHKDNKVVVSLPTIINLGSLFEPVPENHNFIDLWTQAAAA